MSHDSVAQHEAIVLPWLIFPADCLGVSALALFLPFSAPKAQMNSLLASERRTSGSERAGWSQGFSVSGADMKFYASNGLKKKKSSIEANISV